MSSSEVEESQFGVGESYPSDDERHHHSEALAEPQR